MGLNTGSISDSLASGNVYGDNYLGYFVGANFEPGSITTSEGSGNVFGHTETHLSGEIDEYVGGFAGYTWAPLTPEEAIGYLGNNFDDIIEAYNRKNESALAKKNLKKELLNKDLIREILDLDKKDSPEFVEADTVVDYKKWHQSKIK